MRSVRVGGQVYPLVPPSVRDPRLHLAAVIISIHILGQVALEFRVSVPQIITAIMTCALIEVVWTFATTRQIVWPASAMLTGSGVALILRLVGAERGDHWSWAGWQLFAGVAAFSLITKYLIRFRGTHLFNPSNLGLVVAFLVLGSRLIEPLDFWWSPLDPWMAASYVIILAGGLLITNRLRLLAMAAAFWVSLVAGIGVLSASGHCMTTAWALQPVCGSRFWWVIVTSPEVLIFLFFMITDPKTIPDGRSARVVFAVSLGLVCTLLIAPQTTEFGAKVGLLAGLVVMTPTRFLFDRYLTRDRTDPARLLTILAGDGHAPGRWRLFGRGVLAGSLAIMIALGIVIAGAPARQPVLASDLEPAPVEVEVDPTTLPVVTVSADALALNGSVDPDALALALAESLAIENEAMLRSDTSLLRAADDGERLVEMERKIEDAATKGEYPVVDHRFDSLHLDVVFTAGSQGGASLGLVAAGTQSIVTYDADQVEIDAEKTGFETTFVLRQTGDLWLITATRSPDVGGGEPGDG